MDDAKREASHIGDEWIGDGVTECEECLVEDCLRHGSWVAYDGYLRQGELLRLLEKASLLMRVGRRSSHSRRSCKKLRSDWEAWRSRMTKSLICSLASLPSMSPSPSLDPTCKHLKLRRSRLKAYSSRRGKS